MPPSSNSTSRPSAARTIDLRSLVLLLGFLMVVGLLGGSSRHDAIQIAALRPLGGVFFAIAIYYTASAQVVSARPLISMLALLTLWMFVQLVPLPPSMWQSLPGREAIIQLGQAAGEGAVWRPISMSPSRGFNSLFSLIVPAAALMLAVATSVKSRVLLQLVSVLGVLDAFLGLLQIVSGRGSPLYTYAITNDGSAVGIFANENHSAVFSAIVLLIIARLGVTSKMHKEPAWLRITYVPTFVIVLLAIVVSGSRAGLTMGLLSLVVSIVLLLMAPRGRRTKERGVSKTQQWIAANPRILLSVFAAMILLLLGAFVFLGRAAGLESAVSEDPLEDLRWKIVPILGQILEGSWLVGVGFGSFDRVYMIYEPTNLLMPFYVNQAHNDWAQLLIEGGVPAAILLFALFVWIARAVWSISMREKNGFGGLLFWATLVAILCVASVFDYPLRAPAFQLVGIWLLMALLRERAESQQAKT